MYYAKAIAAFITPLLVAPLAYIGVTPDMPFATALEIIIVAVITGFMVYIVPNRG